MSEPAMSDTGKPLSRGIPRTVWALGFVSLFMDVSSELVHSLLPLYMVGTLGISMLAVGIIEGVAEATALIVKVFSGALSDFIGRRKELLLLGYGLAALTKPLFPLASSAELVFSARLLDRIGKGIRGAPRDALVADVAPAEIRGACFGLRQSLDTVGAFLGPILAIGLMLWLANDIAQVLWLAVIPAALAVALLVFAIREPEHAPGRRHFQSPLRLASLRRFSRHYWWVVAIGAAFTLARFSEAFLVLRAQQLGFSAAWVPLVMVVMAGFYMVSAYPVGKWSDRINRSALLSVGLLLLILADLVLAYAESVPQVLLGVALWGLHMGFSQGILATLVADTTPADLKGTAFGVFNLLSGMALLLASVIAGWLWQAHGAALTFYAGAGFAGLSLLLLMGKPKSQ
ncbi:MFS transporter [Pseudomonas chlororaphis]|uniref:MFS transporter n=1 Tax=Pseudomonas chlororaphis TaxID=587753 RepID=UPI0006A58FE9|nr:MFS transporter [Pseudomonas chlororaphis]AZD01554.1 putative MFS-type transporter [Pseudomonas chlororaphis subsp. chlororaphis]MBM0284797.1 MFS transporter [Pseudomonas chlororaphis]MDO1505903.1 MFS transporter [Pseudomonas chlororaphis]ORM49637.1 MFS transporter [Pseudomonas chlororaphis subsp. chlororaphis]TWR98916.1 MFS transporter [Pseudomonas chlororaphis subsp. chlororaphis]